MNCGEGAFDGDEVGVDFCICGGDEAIPLSYANLKSASGKIRNGRRS